MRYLEPTMELNTFSYIARGSSKNEEKWVDLVNQHVGACSYKVFESNDMFQELESLIKLQGEPFTSSSIYAQYKIFQKVKEEGVVVNLDGQGADELLAGYFGYPHARFESLISSGNFFDIIKLWKGLGDTFGNKPSMDLLKSLCLLIYMRYLDHGKIESIIESF